MENNKTRALYFDYLRIAATIAVIIIHVTSQNIVSHTFDFDWHILNIFNASSRWSVPIFFMISGALFLNPDKHITTKELFTKNIIRLLISYFFWSLLYSLLHHKNSLSSFVRHTIAGHYHMWFILAIIGLYILTPLLRKITESRKLTKYFLILALCLSIFPKFLILILNECPISQLHAAADILTSFLSSIGTKLIQGYSFFYVLGYYLHTTDFTKLARIVSYLLGLLGFILTIGLTAISSIHKSEMDQSYYSYLSVNVILEAIGVFVFAKYELSKIKASQRFASFIQKISKYTFGCYLMHDFVIYGFANYLHIDATYYNPLVAVPFLTVVTFTISTLASALLNHIPILKKYIV